MNQTLSLVGNDFKEKLNLDGVSNLEKGINETDFALEYQLSKAYNVYPANGLAKMILEVENKIGEKESEIEKAEDEAKEAQNELLKAEVEQFKTFLSGLKRVDVLKADDTREVYYVDKIEKATTNKHWHLEGNKRIYDYSKMDTKDHKEAAEYHFNEAEKYDVGDKRAVEHDKENNKHIKLAKEKSEKEPKDVVHKNDGTKLYGKEAKDWIDKRLQKSGEDTTIEKANISEALNGFGNAGLKFNKKGKEIVEKLKSLKEKIAAEKLLVKNQLEALDDKLADKPTEPMSEWNYGNFTKSEIGEFKLYNYNKCYCSEDKVGRVTEMSSYSSSGQKVITGAKTKEEAALYNKYNELTRKCLQLCIDYKNVEVYERNLEDTKSYELTPGQASILGF